MNHVRTRVRPTWPAGRGYFPSLWVDDAATALLAALERAPSGVYNVADDGPATRTEFNRALAHALGRRRLITPPVWLARRVGGGATDALLRSQRVSNRRFKTETNWAPTVPGVGDGLPMLVAAAASTAHLPTVSTQTRLILAIMAVATLVVGLWQQLAPRFSDDEFPGAGLRWVSVDGPYHEHLLRDVGGGNLALAVVALFGLAKPSAILVRTIALAGLVSQIPHFIYHMLHLGLLPTIGDQVA
jgi:hypothetical protein